MTQAELFMLIGIVVTAVALVVVVRMRHRSHAEEMNNVADDVLCEHLRPAWRELMSRGHRTMRVGQRNPDLPMEIHISPAFDPQALYDELKLEDPVFLSDRNVLYCKDDWCEIHPSG